MAERVQLAVLTIVCGKDVEEGFGIAFRVIQDYSLRAVDVFELAGQTLVWEGRLRDLVHLISCIQSSGVSDGESICDHVAAAYIEAIVTLWQEGWEEVECAVEDESIMERSGGKGAISQVIDPLLKVIVNPSTKMSAYITCGQLKNAYLIAIKINSNQDVERIAKEAERLGQSAILRICLRRLEMAKGDQAGAPSVGPNTK
ncbi:zinc finger FYVE domain-containing protein 26 homolog [Hetaerina americana]|uniref:zinc finger FYVE domain-containing protein 26 homolog n=1 Tax=Hetaerina americana TaxID=62018 RepID=UPI003A7F440C